MQRFDALFTLNKLCNSFLVWTIPENYLWCNYYSGWVVTSRKSNTKNPARNPTYGPCVEGIELWLIPSRTGVSLFNGLHNPEQWLIHKVKISLSWPFDKALYIYTYIYIMYIYWSSPWDRCKSFRTICLNSRRWNVRDQLWFHRR